MGIGGIAESADADAEEAERACDELVAGEEVTGETVDLLGGVDGFFDAELSGEGGEVAVADFDLDGACGELVFGEGLGDVVGHFAEGGT